MLWHAPFQFSGWFEDKDTEKVHKCNTSLCNRKWGKSVTKTGLFAAFSIFCFGEKFREPKSTSSSPTKCWSFVRRRSSVGRIIPSLIHSISAAAAATAAALRLLTSAAGPKRMESCRWADWLAGGNNNAWEMYCTGGFISWINC
jgi:hypothetical protein